MKSTVTIRNNGEAHQKRDGAESQHGIEKNQEPSRLSRFYYSLRIYLHRKRWLLRFTQILRGWLILGPLRPIAVRYYRGYRHVDAILRKNGSFPPLDAEQIVKGIDQRGYSRGGQISEACVAEIIQFCDNTKLMKYWNPHKQCEAIDALARHSTVVDIARRYLGAEPILWLTQLRWTFGDPSEHCKVVTSLHPEPVQYDGDAFHYDTLDFKSLTVFIYLTDVGPESGPHVVIENTHKKKSFKEICHIILTDTVAQTKFGDRIKMILGPKGTVFFEDTSCFHKAAKCRTKRLMLSIDYVLQRTPPPERRPLATV
jgi:hypothetical protein